ncbi:30S ribosomal protein S4 [Candidatus Woesearchaeota archaeon]|nr:30S ribosomal protein S4 [Candidatus Woesearchaeota archaeon]
MGDPKKLRKKYSKPSHPWQKMRIEEERTLMNDYGLKNKKELWKMSSTLKKYKKRVKDLVPRKDKQAELEKDQLLSKMKAMNLIKSDAILEDVLSISVKDLLERRLQTLVLKQGYASSIKQARQFVTHEHVTVRGKMINSPSYLVTLEEQSMINVSERVSGIKEPDEEESPKPKKEEKDGKKKK